MIGKLMSKEGVNAALVLALSGALMVLVTKGDGPLSLGRVVTGVLSNPVPKGGADATHWSSSVPAPRRQQQLAA